MPTPQRLSMADEIIAEVWVPIEEHPGYEVSNLGRVRSCDRHTMTVTLVTRRYRGRVLKASVVSGYRSVSLGRDNTFLVHILVCKAFNGPSPTPQHEVAHWDG